MKKGLLIYFLVFISILNVNAQNTQYLFTGKVTDGNGAIKNVHIVNLQTNQGTYSNELGEYRIYASLGDSLKISSVQYATKIRMVTNYDLKSKIINISLQEKSYELDEIVVKKTNLSGNLLSDIKRKPKHREISAVTLGLPNAGRKKMSQIDRKLYSLRSSSSGIPLGLLISLISGQYKKLKEEEKLIKENHDVEKMMEKIKHFLTSDFNIKEEDHYRFLYYCRNDSTFTKDVLKNEFALIEFLKKRSIEFQKTLQDNSEEKNKN